MSELLTEESTPSAAESEADTRITIRTTARVFNTSNTHLVSTQGYWTFAVKPVQQCRRRRGSSFLRADGNVYFEVMYKRVDVPVEVILRFTIEGKVVDFGGDALFGYLFDSAHRSWQSEPFDIKDYVTAADYSAVSLTLTISAKPLSTDTATIPYKRKLLEVLTNISNGKKAFVDGWIERIAGNWEKGRKKKRWPKSEIFKV